MKKRLLRAFALVLAGCIAALGVVVGYSACEVGWPETRDQMRRFALRIEGTSFPLISLVLRRSGPEEVVWSSLVYLLAEGPDGAIYPLAVSATTAWSEPVASNVSEMIETFREESLENPSCFPGSFVIKDFVSQNSQSIRLPKSILPDGSILLERAPNQDEGSPESIDTPHGCVELSRVGFSAMGGRTLVYAEYDCGILCGFGSYFVLEKRDGDWQVVCEVVSWVS